MPAYDAELLTRDGSSDLTSSEATPTGIDVGPAPIQGMKLFVFAPEAGGTSPTLDVHLEESDDDSTYTDVENVVVPQITAAGYYEIRAFWTKRYLRTPATLGGTSPDFGATKIGLTKGQIPMTGA